jgi:hypothetical protein
MTITIAARTEAYLKAAEKVHEIELSSRPERERLEEVTSILTALSRRPELFPPEGFPRAPGSSGGLFRLAQFPDGLGSLYVSLGFTGRGGGAPHTHPAWAAVVGISGGVERNWIYDSVEPVVEGVEPKLKLREEVVVGPGEAVLIPTGVFHTIEVVSETPVLHLHAYGRRAERPGFQPPLPSVSYDEARSEAREGAAVVVILDPNVADIAGPHVLAAKPSDVAAALAERGVSRRLPVIVAGSSEAAGEVAAALYADGRAVVFHLDVERLAKAA